MAKLYRRLSKSQPWYLGQKLYWLVYKVFWWLYFSFPINSPIFSPIKLCNLWNGQFNKYPMSQTVKNKMSLIPILYFIANCLKLPYISKLVNLTHTFKISLKAIIMRTTSQFHNGVRLKIPLLSYFSGILHILKGKPFMKMNMKNYINSQILNAILLLISIKSEILLLN